LLSLCAEGLRSHGFGFSVHQLLDAATSASCPKLADGLLKRMNIAFSGYLMSRKKRFPDSGRDEFVLFRL